MSIGRILVALFVWFVLLPIISILAYCTFWGSMMKSDEKTRQPPARISETASSVSSDASKHVAKSHKYNPTPHRGTTTHDDASPSSGSNSETATPVHPDPKHPLKLGEDFYPDASKRAGEEGRCIVSIKVTSEGMIEDEAIQVSSGYWRLDDACLKAVHGQRMMPATEHGVAVTKQINIPIVWSLTGK